MELKDKIQAALAAFPLTDQVSVLKVKSVGGRVVVYISSPAFAKKTSLQKQRLIDQALRRPGALEPDELRKIGLVRTIAPKVVSQILKNGKSRLKSVRKKRGQTP